MKISKYLTVASIGLGTSMIMSNTPALAINLLTSNPGINPGTLTQPTTGFKGQFFTVVADAKNNNDFDVILNSFSGNIVENDFSIGNETIANFSGSNFNQFNTTLSAGGSTTVSREVFVSAQALNAEAGGFEGSALEFELKNPQVSGTAVPEPLTILGSLTAIGMGVKLKKKYLS